MKNFRSYTSGKTLNWCSLITWLLFTPISLLAQEGNKEQVDVLLEETVRLISDNNNDSALLTTGQALHLSNTLKYDYGKARALTLRGNFYLNKAQLDSAELLFDEANRLYLDNNIFGDTLQSNYHHLIAFRGAWNVYKRNFRTAEQLLKTAMIYFKVDGDKRRLRYCLSNLGRLNGISGNYTEALDYFLQCHDQYDGEESPNASNILGNIALCYKFLGHVDKAREYLTMGLALDLKNDWHSQMHKFNNLATICYEVEDIDSAIYYDTKAYESARRFGNYSTAVISISNLAQYYAIKRELSTADSIMKIALPLADSVGINSVEEQFDIVNAELAFDRADYDSTLFYARRALSSTAQYSHKRFSSIVSQLMSNTFQLRGELDSSLYYLKIHHAYEDSLFNKESQKKVTELYTKMESMQKDRAIEVLQKDKQLEAMKKQRLTVIIGGVLTVSVLLIIALIYRHKNRLRREEVKQVKLKSDLEQGRADLDKQTLNMIHMNNCMDNLEEQVRASMTKSSDPEYRKILHTIRMNKSLKKDWENFNNYFSNSHSEFYDKLSDLNDSLSNHEKRVCALIKLNLSNHEIATILNIEKRSAVMIKYRIKKKMGLEEARDLNAYVQEL